MRHGRIEAAEGRHLRTLFELGAAGTLSDGQLLERFATRTGDAAELAFAALVERHGPMILRVARAVLRDEHSAHDAFQATFLILARKGRSLWVRDSLGPWLHAVAWRVASQGRLAEARRRRSERSAARPESTSPPIDDLARALHEEIARLPAPYRSAVVACHLEGLTQRDAARHLGWPVGTLQSRLDRARRKLRERLARRGFAPSLARLSSLPIPDALIHATARAAAAGPSAGLVGPAVLSLVNATTKGLIMAPWKLAAAALVMAGGLAGSGLYIGDFRTARATDGPGVEAPQVPARPGPEVSVRADRPKAQAGPTTVDVDIHGFRYPAPASLLAAAGRSPGLEEPTIPPPADGPGFPVLLEFYEASTPLGRQHHDEIGALVQAGYPIKSVPVGVPDRGLPLSYEVRSVPTYVLVNRSGEEIIRHTGSHVSAKALANFYNDNRNNRPMPVPPTAIEPALNIPGEPRPNPKPWETAVRIKIHLSDKEWNFSSGTIIRSTPEESIILTSAEDYLPKYGSRPVPTDFRPSIAVDLFDGILGGPRRSMVHCSEKDLRGELIDADHDRDVALLRIRPGRVLHASPVVGTGWLVTSGLEMVAVGCSHGNDATAWNTKILDPRVMLKPPFANREFATIMCEHQPAEGRSGGGLFTTAGYLAGVCDFADSNEKVGLYAIPESIHRLLDRNGLSTVYGADPNLARSADPKRWDVTTFPDNSHIKRLDDLPGSPAKLEPKPVPPVSDTDRRLADLERKLDRVVEALENLGAGKKPDGPIGDFGKPPRPNLNR